MGFGVIFFFYIIQVYILYLIFIIRILLFLQETRSCSVKSKRKWSTSRTLLRNKMLSGFSNQETIWGPSLWKNEGQEPAWMGGGTNARCGQGASPVAQLVKNPPVNAGDARDASLFPGSRRSLEDSMATHSRSLPLIELTGTRPVWTRGAMKLNASWGVTCLGPTRSLSRRISGHPPQGVDSAGLGWSRELASPSNSQVMQMRMVFRLHWAAGR